MGSRGTNMGHLSEPYTWPTQCIPASY